MKLQIGGSPCTHWSIAQTKNRETQPKGLGWDLFENFLIALKKFQPDYFLYENNKSMSAAIRAEITNRFGVEPICINSAKVSAQNRQRLYWCGKRNLDGTYSTVPIEQPDDRGILLRDILESGVAFNEKGYTLKAQYYKSSTANMFAGHYPAPMAAEPVRIGTIENSAKNADFDSKQYRVYSPDGKSVTLCGQGGGVGAKTGLYAVPVKEEQVGVFPNKDGELTKCQSKRIYSIDAKGRVLNAGPGGLNEAIQRFQRFELNENPQKTNCLSTVEKDNLVIQEVEHKVWSDSGLTETGETKKKRKVYPVYEVRNGLITINGKQYPIKLPDGFYIIRKLTVLECMRLQTVPEWYIFPVSDTQAYKMLGNGWTVDVIAYLMSHFDGITTEPLDVLSMYDGMACGHIALDKLVAHIKRYRATEIDKYAIKTACYNFPDIEQLGDAFQVRTVNTL